MRRPREQHSSFRFRFTSVESCLSKRTIESEYCLVIVTHRAPALLPGEFTNSAPTRFYSVPSDSLIPPDTLSMITNTLLVPLVCGLSVSSDTDTSRHPAFSVSKILVTFLIDESVRQEERTFN